MTEPENRPTKQSPSFRHDPYHGLAYLAMPQESGINLDEALAKAEDSLGCVPTGRLRRLVFLSTCAAMLQRVRDKNGLPLLLAKGGLILQDLLPGSARPTRDLDGTLRCEPEPFLDHLEHALSIPWGTICAHIADVDIHRDELVPFDALELTISLSDGEGQPERIPVDITLGLCAEAGDADAYPAPSLDRLGIPVPDCIWGLSPSRMLAEKVITCCEPHDPDGLAGVRPARPNKHGKHLADLVLLVGLCEEGKISAQEAADSTRKLLESCEALRAERGFLPYERPLRVKPHDHWRGEYLVACLQSGQTIPLDQAVAQVNAWLEQTTDSLIS